MKDSMINVQYKFSSEIGPNRIIWPLKQSIVSFGAKGKATGAGDKMKTRKTWGGFKWMEVMVAEPAVWLPLIVKVGGIWSY